MSFLLLLKDNEINYPYIIIITQRANLRRSNTIVLVVYVYLVYIDCTLPVIHNFSYWVWVLFVSTMYIYL